VVRYFSCMWCKRSSKKHKRWEGDAVLVVRGRSATLQDQDGKELGSTTSYPHAQLASLSDGETLVIGSKEVEVGAPIAQKDYESGQARPLGRGHGSPGSLCHGCQPLPFGAPLIHPAPHVGRSLAPVLCKRAPVARRA